MWLVTALLLGAGSLLAQYLPPGGASNPATVMNNIPNTGTAAMTLDMSAASSAAAVRVPNIAGASSTTSGVLSYDTTNKNFHGGANGVDNIVPVVPSSLSITDSNCASWSNVGGVITLKQAAGACAAGGSGTVNSGTQGQLAWYATSTTAVSGNANFALNAGGTALATFGGITTVGTGVPVEGWESNVTGVTANQSVTLATGPTAGLYRLNYYADLGTAQSGCSVSLAFNWSDAAAARSLTTGNLSLATQSTAAYLSGLLPIYVNSGNVTYTSTMSGCGSGAYDIHVSMERMK